MPDFVRLTDAKNGRKIVVVTSAIGAAIADFSSRTGSGPPRGSRRARSARR